MYGVNGNAFTKGWHFVHSMNMAVCAVDGRTHHHRIPGCRIWIHLLMWWTAYRDTNVIAISLCIIVSLALYHIASSMIKLITLKYAWLMGNFTCFLSSFETKIKTVVRMNHERLPRRCTKTRLDTACNHHSGRNVNKTRMVCTCLAPRTPGVIWPRWRGQHNNCGIVIHDDLTWPNGAITHQSRAI
jgi:hypothetical protein